MSEKQTDLPGPVLSKLDDKAHVPLSKLDLIKIDENALNSEKQSESAVPELSKSERKRTEKKLKLISSVADDKAHVPFGELNLIKMEENIMKVEQQSELPGSPSTSLVKEHGNNVEGDLVVQMGYFKSYQMNDNSNNHQRRKRLFSDSEEKVEPIMGTRQTSPDSNEVPSLKISENEVESLQSGVCSTSFKVVEDILTENPIDDIACARSDYVMEIKWDVDLDYQIKDNLPQVSHSSIEELHVGRPDKKLLILDVNGLLADILPYGETSKKAHITISRKSVFKRPFCDDFLQFCFEKFNVGVWSSRTEKNVDAVIKFLMGDSKYKLLFCWHQSQCTDTGFGTVENSSKPLVFKELRKLWHKIDPHLPWNKGDFDESNTLLLDDSPYKALRNPPHTAIFPASYSYKDAEDSSLGPGGDLRLYLEKLAKAPNVQDFVAKNPFGQQAISESNPSWGFYQKILRVCKNVF